jgi:hypothetical protein
MAVMYEAFGDESCGTEYVAYGTLLLEDHQRTDAEDILAKIKLSYGGNPDCRLHCRELFSGDARRKTPWSHLSIDDVFKLYTDLMTELVSVGMRRLVTFAQRSVFLSGQGRFAECSRFAARLAIESVG